MLTMGKTRNRTLALCAVPALFFLVLQRAEDTEPFGMGPGEARDYYIKIYLDEAWFFIRTGG
jgi:hypothetical protein